jgi:hypothetical protein
MQKILTSKGWRDLYLTENLNEISDHDQLITMKKDTEGNDKPTFKHSQRKILQHLAKDKTLAPHLKGAYMDDDEIIHGKTGKTIATIGKSTMGDLKKAVLKNVSSQGSTPGAPKGDTFAPQGSHKGGKIVTVTSKPEAQRVAMDFRAKGHKVGINTRKDGFKVYIYNK